MGAVSPLVEVSFLKKRRSRLFLFICYLNAIFWCFCFPLNLLLLLLLLFDSFTPLYYLLLLYGVLRLEVLWPLIQEKFVEPFLDPQIDYRLISLLYYSNFGCSILLITFRSKIVGESLHFQMSVRISEEILRLFFFDIFDNPFVSSQTLLFIWSSGGFLLPQSLRKWNYFSIEDF